MDGNRRWEKEQLKRLKGKGINKGEEDNDIKNESKSSNDKGHERGAKTLQNVLRWSLKLPQIETISVYAFSLENFNRDTREVDGLMSLCLEELPKLARSDAGRNANARIVISGRLDALSEEVRQAACGHGGNEEDGEMKEKKQEDEEEVKREDCRVEYLFGVAARRSLGAPRLRRSRRRRRRRRGWEEDGEESIKRRFYYGGNGSENRYVEIIVVVLRGVVGMVVVRVVVTVELAASL